MPDKRAIKTLTSTYWSATGWRAESERTPPVADFEYAKQKGVMFDPITINHDAVVGRVIAARDSLPLRRLTDAFLSSLSSRRLDLRSALGSYAVFRHMPKHPSPRFGEQCAYCGAYENDRNLDLNVLNFERFKWGGVRHDHPVYAMLDLELFQRESTVEVDSSDNAALRSIVSAIEQVAANTTAAALEAHFATIVRSNKAERNVIVALLGFCGILKSPGHASYWEKFVPFKERDLPAQRFVDMSYPACWWRREYGIESVALKDYFGYAL